MSCWCSSAVVSHSEVYSNMNSGVLQLKLHKVYFADKFAGAKVGGGGEVY